MAQMFPSRFPYPKEPSRTAERKFFNACQQQLDDSWTILYEQRWHGTRNGQNQRGEADFLMLSTAHGAFVVEVKGGALIEVRDGNWFSHPHGSESPKPVANPFNQAADSKSVLWDYLREHVPSLRLKGELGHMVVFPGHRQEGDMSPQARRELICDSEDLRDLPSTMTRLSRCFSQRTRWTDEDVRAAKEKLMPTFRLVGARRVEFDEFVDELERLTELQLTAFAMLRNLRTLTVHGGAGSGKTVLALNRAIELSLDGLRVLYLCSSDPLKEFLETYVEKNWGQRDLSSLQIHSTRSFQVEIMRLTGRQFVNEPEDFLAACNQLATSSQPQFDAFIIDEAQNVHEAFALAALTLVEDDGYRYVFGDTNQSTEDLRHSLIWFRYSLEKRFVTALEDFSSEDVISLNINCRSSKQIAEFANEIVGQANESFGERFEEVVTTAVPVTQYGIAVTDAVSDFMFRFGLRPNEIAVLMVSGTRQLGRLLTKSRFVDDLGLLVTSDLVIDWLGHRVDEGVCLSFIYELHDIDEYLLSPGATVHGQEIEFQFRVWRNTKKGWFHSKALRLPCSVETELLQSGEVSSDSQEDALSRLSPSELAALFMKVRRRRLTSLALPVISCSEITEFIGLEAHAVVAVLPKMFEPADKWFVQNVYSMSTRARALLALIGDDDVIKRVNSLRTHG